MNNKIEYELITGAESAHVEQRVRDKLAEGWEPLGGVSIAMDHYPQRARKDFEYRPCFHYAQAIIRHHNY